MLRPVAVTSCWAMIEPVFVIERSVFDRSRIDTASPAAPVIDCVNLPLLISVGRLALDSSNRPVAVGVAATVLFMIKFVLIEPALLSCSSVAPVPSDTAVVFVSYDPAVIVPVLDKPPLVAVVFATPAFKLELTMRTPVVGTSSSSPTAVIVPLLTRPYAKSDAPTMPTLIPGPASLPICKAGAEPPSEMPLVVSLVSRMPSPSTSVLVVLVVGAASRNIPPPILPVIDTAAPLCWVSSAVSSAICASVGRESNR